MFIKEQRCQEEETWQNLVPELHSIRPRGARIYRVGPKVLPPSVLADGGFSRGSDNLPEPWTPQHSTGSRRKSTP